MVKKDIPKFKTLELFFTKEKWDDNYPYEILGEIMRKTRGTNLFEKYWVQDFGTGDRYFLDFVEPKTDEELEEIISPYFNKIKRQKRIDNWRPFDRTILDMFVPGIEKIDFNTLFSVTAQNIRTSYIRLLLSLLEEKDIISFAGGIPDPKEFPIEVVGYLLKEKIMIDENEFAKAKQALQYGKTAGMKNLREKTLQVAEETLKIKDQTMDNIVITTGSQQALFGLAHIIINKWDSIVVEAPTYLGALNPFGMHTSKFHNLDLDMKTGPDPGQLERILKKDNPKFIYLIPNFQNPSGVTTPWKVRKEIYELVCKHNEKQKGAKAKHKTVIIEDDPYGSLRYEKKYIPPMKSIDTEEIVVYLGSFSKIFSPGIRLGCMIARKDIAEKLIGAKQSYDLHSSNLSQSLAYEFLMEGEMVSGHIKNIIKKYGEKRDVMLKEMKKSGLRDAGFDWTEPEGGMFLWMTGPEEWDAKENLEREFINKDSTAFFNKVFRKTIPDFKDFNNRVAYVPGAPFFASEPMNNTARLNFSKPTLDEIKEGVRIMSTILIQEPKSY